MPGSYTKVDGIVHIGVNDISVDLGARLSVALFHGTLANMTIF